MELYDFGLSDDEVVALTQAEEAGCIAKFHDYLKPCTNARSTLESLSLDYGLAVVSSSATNCLDSSLAAVDFLQYSPPDKVFPKNSAPRIQSLFLLGSQIPQSIAMLSRFLGNLPASVSR